LKKNTIGVRLFAKGIPFPIGIPLGGSRRKPINIDLGNSIGVGLLMNFGKKAEFKKKIFTNDRK